MLNIYKASAGSGKTYTLAYEYIKALIGISNPEKGTVILNHPSMTGGAMLRKRHSHILAITFTNKATNEMKSRIVAELVALSDVNSESNYASDLIKEFGCSREQLSQTAKAALGDILTAYSDFNVTTIDSFFQRVMRTFARELERQGDYSVELSDKVTVQRAVDSMLTDFNNRPKDNDKLGRWLYDYLIHRVDDGKKANFFNRKSRLFSDLVKQVSHICEEPFKPYSDDMRVFLSDPDNIKKFTDEIDAQLRASLNHLKDLTLQTISQLNADGVDISDLNGTFKLGPVINDYLKEGLPVKNEGTFLKPGNTVDKMLTEGKRVFKAKSRATDHHESLLTELMRHARKQYVYMHILRHIRQSISDLSLLSHAWGYLDGFVQENNIILLSDTNHLLQKIIGQDETPFIYERLGVQLQHFLIDEFQDTSRMQWSNLKPLVANDIAIYDSLIIGDEKQSIYRFRNSDSSLLGDEVARDFEKNQTLGQQRGAQPGENTNYRSSVEVVGFNNFFFTQLSQQLKAPGYGNVRQDIPDKNRDKRGCVRLLSLSENDSALDRMVEQIRRQHTDGRYDWRDIAVLVEKREQGAKVVERLMLEGIPVVSDESLFLYKSTAVQMVLGVLRLYVNDQKPGKRQDPQTGKHYPTPTELKRTISRFEYYRDKGMDIDESIDAALRDEYQVDADKTQSHSAVAGLSAIRKHQPSSLVALVDSIIHEELPADLRNSQMSYLLAFQDFVLDYSSRYIPSVQGLLSAWDQQGGKLSISSGTDMDKVKVMTIHKSKGLEFDCVHIPFATWDLVGRPSGQWLPMNLMQWGQGVPYPPALFVQMDDVYGMSQPFRELYMDDLGKRVSDQLNKTYVAFTRAVYELDIYYQAEVGIGSWINDFAKTLSVDNLCDASGSSDIELICEPESTDLIIGCDTRKNIEPKNKGGVATIHIDTYDVSLHTTANIMATVADEADDDDGKKKKYDEYGGDEVARLRGIAKHRAMSMIIAARDRQRAIDTVCRSSKLTDDDRKDIKMTIDSMFACDNPLVGKWYAEDVDALNEQPLYDAAEGDVRRLDRMVRYSDGSVDVIDYKFTTEVQPEHRRQVQRYGQILRGIDPTVIVRGYLWYPQLNNKIITVDE